MKIEFNEEDIVKEIKENFSNNPHLLFEIIDKSTSDYHYMTTVVSMIIEELRVRGNNYELGEIQILLDKAKP